MSSLANAITGGIRCQGLSATPADLETLLSGMLEPNNRMAFGSRVAFDNAGMLYASVGDRGPAGEPLAPSGIAAWIRSINC